MRSTLFFLLIASTAAAQPFGTFVRTGDMHVAREGHTATLLQDGRVLMAGGSSDTTAEVYDPATGTFSPTGNMMTARHGHTATLLADGRVLVAGGNGLSSAEIYDPRTGEFTATGAMLEDQFGHSATLLPNGKVLIAGGERAAPPWPTSARAEIYDPASGTFSFAGSYAEDGTLYPSGGPVWPTSNLLRDGRVLVAGENPPEIYDPSTDSFRTTGRLVSSSYRYGMNWQSATTLRDGTVLVAGGSDDFDCAPIRDAEIYDPATNAFTPVGPMTAERALHAATLLADGTVLITGGGDGWCGAPTLDGAELYIPSERSFMPDGFMTRTRSGHTATLLNDGTVLIAGGFSLPYSVTNTAEVYRPSTTRSGRRGTQR
ncbi:MAG TPA: kelch repeat-containing protein [Thermoanaerobaculia bacterium]|nr:kelch repeat-containing protein [Thermoanaerobaculia bacterium]